jgi:hypothetical protein
MLSREFPNLTLILLPKSSEVVGIQDKKQEQRAKNQRKRSEQKGKERAKKKSDGRVVHQKRRRRKRRSRKAKGQPWGDEPVVQSSGILAVASTVVALDDSRPLLALASSEALPGTLPDKWIIPPSSNSGRLSDETSSGSDFRKQHGSRAK